MNGNQIIKNEPNTLSWESLNKADQSRTIDLKFTLINGQKCKPIPPSSPSDSLTSTVKDWRTQHNDNITNYYESNND